MLVQALERAVQVNPTGLALVSDAERVSWAELGARLAAVAGGLAAIGVRPGDRVALLASNSSAHLELIYAICWAGAVIVPLNARLAPTELADLYRHSEAQLLLFDDAVAALAGEVVARCRVEKALLIDSGPARHGATHTYDRDLASARPIAPVHRGRDEIAGLFYTGGTTGIPKGVILSDGALGIQSVNMMHDTGLTERSVHLHATPLFHIASFGFAWACVYAAAAQACLGRFEPERVYEMIESTGASSIMIVPTMIDPLVTSASGRKAALRRIETVTYGAAPITQQALGALIQGFPKARFQQFYGQTEAGGPCLTLAPQDHRSSDGSFPKLHTAGRSTSTYVVNIADENGVEVERGTPGEIVVCGPGLMSGYWRADDITASVLVDGWLKSGDVGIMDDDGYVAVVDRIKDMIVTGGENVFSSEVENVLASHPDVAQCAVVGIPDEKWGELVCAVVVRRPGVDLSPQDLIDFCRTRVGGFKCPKRIVLRDAPLPLSGVGKVQKNILRAEIQRGDSRS